MIDAVHVDGSVVILEFVERPSGVVVARRVTRKRRVQDDWQRHAIWVAQWRHQGRCGRRDLSNGLRRLNGECWEAEGRWRRVQERHRALTA